MGTRADFYVGRGEQAEWIGSYPFDGYPDGIADNILDAKTEADYRAAVQTKLIDHDCGTLPEQGWPWPWDTSRTTDYAYAFDDGKVHCSSFGSEWFDPRNEPDDLPKTAVFPDMSDRKNVTFGERSGLIVIGSGQLRPV